MKEKIVLLFVIITLSLGSCREIRPKPAHSNFLEETSFDTIIDQQPIRLYWLENENLKIAITNYGGRIVSMLVKDKDQEFIDVSIGRGSVKEYIQGPESYFGATIGRVGNRIAAAAFNLDKASYNLYQNDNGNTLHGGLNGFQDKIWNVKKSNKEVLELYYFSPDMEEGFPGVLETGVTFSLTETSGVKISYEATTSKATVVNLTNHTYFNLNGEGSGQILNHELKINSNAFTPVNESLIPTGEIKSVLQTPFDFKDFHRIGERIEQEDPQLIYGGGYDHNFVLNRSDEKLDLAATVVGDISGIIMKVYTTEPGLQFYSGNFMQSENLLKSGVKDDFRTAFCLETQHFPDSPNQESFPSIRLNPSERYLSTTVYEFSTK